ncbi:MULTISPECIES: cation diffusion facilitator family transporter [unclassified Clostridium]|uniref:cation diffusion facilitator family transporter n=1 Tax=Clostridium TaxID=1485 RepID=UPI001C8BB5B8|nr:MULTISPECIES: cation diffusion facilitator family transporter [unclassified Clostridium]MBX9138308.1 cation transporter [Clostridium sp. K12(2020)]MBX9145032.1 cation transporter [Clostridium sp. K13]MDU2290879.1 cation diffusion facilitator family transporter [Clostridium celatum]MDU4325260.1 cation diffusion facilitator family transporter [Clostridium celatum]
MEKRYDESNKVTILSILLNIGLTIMKILAGVFGNSTAIIADGLHSASDIITSIGILIGNKISRKPRDEEHQYGHEKAESLVAFVLAAVLIIVAVEIGYKGVAALFNLNEIQVPTLLPLIVALISIGVKEYQYQITIRVAKKINSSSLKADAWHHRSDALSSIAAFIGIGGAMLGFKILDPIASIIVAIVVVKVGIDILKSACDELMDSSISKQDIGEIKSMIDNNQKIYGIKDFKSRKYGSVAYIDMSIFIDKAKTLEEAHDIADDLEHNIISTLSYIKEINIHTEPYNN